MKTIERVHVRIATELPINAVVAPAIVDDPYSDCGEKLEVLRSVRDDPLAGMAARGQIEDHLLKAGRRWQALLEQAEIGSVSAIDPTKEAVDGGRIPEPITDRQIRAIRQLAEVDRLLGLEGCALIRDILGRRYSIAQAAQVRELTSAREVNYIGRRLRECLETLAIHFGLASR